MEKNDLVLTPDGLLALIEEVGAEKVTVKIANHETRVLYEAGKARLPLVASAADLEQARGALAAPKE